MRKSNKDRKIAGLFFIGLAVTVLVIKTSTSCWSAIAGTEQKSFATGEEAANAFVQALRDGNNEQLRAIFGTEGEELIASGDEVADKQGRQRFLAAYDEQHKLSPEGDDLVMVVGKDAWPFPIPVVKQADKFIFDTAAGKEEILNRRIGRNELDTIQVLLAIVDAEREYARQDHDGDGLLEYAQKIKSDPGKQNGLYWETKEGEDPSPLGPLAAQAKWEGYDVKKSDKPQPYHGYYYRILTGQGPNAPGGAFGYLVKDNMLGFAVVAFPADYASSGVMTFLVNHDGVVYQKDLGENTQQAAQSMKLFDPDKTWIKAQ
jgi:hypothetical protein